MADFAHYFPTLLANEGGYCHDPLDPGGETYRGIARVPNPHWGGWSVVDAIRTHHCPDSPVPRAQWLAISRALETDAALNAQVMAFYKAEYWNSLGLDQVHSQAIADQVADHGVNAGVVRPAKMLQYLLATEFGAHLVVDGKIGLHSIAALNAVDQSAFYNRFIAMRRAFYDYRSGSFSPEDAQKLASWHKFFREELHLVTDNRMQKYLASWLSRTQEKFVA
ncbi:glycoside hydrolase family 108 protein [Hymenobacter cavernae]|uniref:TtsA-like Glycoside hydrolase family 108 domain-containing protein n=1 Tax=Hymenobacter cavernae TaxID=2044852 RepID=A0ABQ1TVF4_9BACT|nr:glycosyl hydrolase 108 family protein [Hymenobacter cavernae]GGF04287.1 hypothetical protein GCM10011383_14210 [Hymenobacter cavernae]